MAERKHYEDTNVPETKTLLEIEVLLKRHGVQTMRWTSGSDMIRIEFVWPLGEASLPFRIDLRFPLKDDSGYSLNQRQKEQERRRMMRVLFHHIKAKLVAVEEGLVDMQTEFLPYLLGPGGVTVGEQAQIDIRAALQSGAIPNIKLLPERGEG